jgi:hypothetical protein
VYSGCFAETGTGQNCYIGGTPDGASVVIGGNLADVTIASNGAGNLPNTIAGSTTNLNFVCSRGAHATPGVITGVAYFFREATYGAQIQGQGATYDIGLFNKSGNVVMSVPTGGTAVNFTSDVNATNFLSAQGKVQVRSSTTKDLRLTCDDTAGTVQVVRDGDAWYPLNLSGSTVGLLSGPTTIGTVSSTGLNMASGKSIQLNGTTVLDGATGRLTASAFPALTGDATTAGGALATTIAANVVTYAKFQQVAASSLVGNPTGSLANAQGVTLAADHAFSGTTLQLDHACGWPGLLRNHPDGSGALTPTSVASTGAITSSSATRELAMRPALAEPLPSSPANPPPLRRSTRCAARSR